jgi:hypothetical protein
MIGRRTARAAGVAALAFFASWIKELNLRLD